MFHKRCRDIETILKRELEEARDRIEKLEEELDRRMMVFPTDTGSEGKVFYMDDKRMVELEDNGPAS